MSFLKKWVSVLMIGVLFLPQLARVARADDDVESSPELRFIERVIELSGRKAPERADYEHAVDDYLSDPARDASADLAQMRRALQTVGVSPGELSLRIHEARASAAQLSPEQQRERLVDLARQVRSPEGSRSMVIPVVLLAVFLGFWVYCNGYSLCGREH
jgi:hypothetical protein